MLLLPRKQDRTKSRMSSGRHIMERSGPPSVVTGSPVEVWLHKPITGIVGRLSGEETLVTATAYARTGGVVEIVMFLIHLRAQNPRDIYLDIVGAYAPKPYKPDGTHASLSQGRNAGQRPPTAVGA